MGCFPALSALPIEDVTEVFEALIDEDIDEKLPAAYISYFENNYIGQKRRNRRLTPTFPIEIWNVRDRILNDNPRTNNAIEGFHSGLNNFITNSHPSLWRLIDGFRTADHMSRKRLAEYGRGDNFSQRANYLRISNRLKNLVERYDSSIPMADKIKFVKSVANLINSN